MTEEWRDIPGYEGWYQVSNRGRVQSVTRFYTTRRGKRGTLKGKVLRSNTDTTGYYSVMLAKNGIHVRKLVHRLVAAAFVPNPYAYPQVNHKDEDKTNNAASNLEWCTRRYNINYGSGRERSNEKHRKQIVQMTIDGIATAEWESIAKAERTTGISNIGKCCRGEQKTSGGYRWKYKETQL